MKALSTFMIILGAVFWGIIGIFVKHLTPYGFTSAELVALRSLITAVSLVVLLILTNPKKLTVKIRHLWYFIGTGFFSFVFFNLCYFQTMNYSSLSVAAILLYTAPFFVMGMSCLFFREKITRGKLLALLLAFLGCVAVSGVLDGGGSISPQGLLWGLGAGFGYALYSIFAKLALKQYDTLTVITYTFLVATVGSFFLITPSHTVAVLQLYPESIWLLLVYGIVTGSAAYYCYTKGLEKTPPAKASVIATVEPVVATLCGAFFFSEIPSVFGILGIFLVIFAVLYLQRQ